MRELTLPILIVLMMVASGCEDKYVAKGHKIFNRFCASCHGEEGNGTGYNAVNLDPAPRDLTDGEEDYMVKLSNDEIFEVLEIGGYGVDLSAGMPVWGKVFSEEQLWSLVAFVRTLHKNEASPIIFENAETKEAVFDHQKPRYERVQEKVFDELMVSMVPDEDAFEELVISGADIFEEMGCNACHVVNGEGGALGPDLSRAGFMLQTQFIYRWIKNPQSFKSKTRMPNLDVPDEDALAIAIYVSTLKGASSDAETLEIEDDNPPDAVSGEEL